MVQAEHVEVDLLEEIIAEMQVSKARQIAEHSLVLKLPDLVLLEMKLRQLRQIAVHEDVMEILGQLVRRVVRKGIRQMKLHKVDEVGEDARMVMVHVVVVTARDREIIMIEDETLHVRHMMIALASYFTYVVVAHVNYC